MGLIYPDLPTVGSPNSTEQPKVRQSLIDLRDTINGSIAAANLATDAVSTAKIADSAVSTAKIADDAVTAAKLATDSVTNDAIGALAVKAGDINLTGHSVVGTAVTGTADHVWASQASVAPGTYVANGYVNVEASAADLRFDYSGGTVSVMANSTLTIAARNVSAIIVVTATTTIRLRGTAAAGLGAMGGFTLFGVSS